MTSFSELEKKTLSYVRYGERIRPVRDWLTLIAIAAVLLVVSGIWNTWLFFDVQQGSTAGSPTVSPPIIDTASTDSVQTVFAERAVQESNYLHTYHFVDPSQ